MHQFIDVLVSTCHRPAALAVTLAALGFQTWPALRIVIADQSDGAGVYAHGEVQAVLRYLRATGRQVETLRNLPRRGMAQQRAFLLEQVQAHYCLFVDDDVILEPDLVARLHAVIEAEGCGFVGSALHGAARLFHVQPRPGLERGGGEATVRTHKLVWGGGCVLFDTACLRAAGAYDFWSDLPAQHCGEDLLAQQRVMARYGGCAIVPSGAYHMELPATMAAHAIDAPYVLPIERC